jgi:hypothetical protein
MLRRSGISDAFRDDFETVAEAVTSCYADGNIQTEPELSGGLITSMKGIDFSDNSESYQIESDVEAYQARDEPTSGADIGIRHQLQTPEFEISRGMIVQSKRYGTQHPELPYQTMKMLLRSPEAYVFTYSKSAIGAFPALPITLDEGQGGKFTKYYCTDFMDLMCGFIEGFHGDVEIAEHIDEPTGVFPSMERVRFIADIKTRVYDDEQIDFGRFDRVSEDGYERIRPEDYEVTRYLQ